MKGKKVSESKVILSHVMQPQDANPAGNIHGGVIMKLIDNAAGVVAIRHARSNAVTASIDRLDFHSPVYIGDLVTLTASLNLVKRSSMEIGVRVESENMISGKTHHTASAYLTFVALDQEGKSLEVPPLILESADEKRRHQEALQRSAQRALERRKQ
ncbi:MAG: acyl-CoA thioesterase [Deltaproteobacteria bacterium]|nr:acyl-CoA thioesterase [Deltaproteobacteria bacterium]